MGAGYKEAVFIPLIHHNSNNIFTTLNNLISPHTHLQPPCPQQCERFLPFCVQKIDNLRAHITSPTMTVNILGPYLEPLNIFSLILQQHCSLEPLSTKLLKETMDITLCAAASERTRMR